MKNEKVCINKSIAFVTAIVVLLLGVVLFANYMNSQNLADNAKAAPAAATFIDDANRLIDCPQGVAFDVFKMGTNYYKNDGVCAACANLEQSNQMKTCQKCCNRPATEAEYLALHPNPDALDCAATGTYSLSANGKTCYGTKTKLFRGGTPNQYCGNETFTDAASWPSACDDLKPDDADCSSGKYSLSANGKTCYGVKTKLFNAGTANQYCGNETFTNAATWPDVCNTLKPADADCSGGTYRLSSDGKTCYGTKTKLFNAGTANQYCGNETITDAATVEAKCGTVDAALDCEGTGTYKLSGDGKTCYGTKTKLFNAGTNNQYCGNATYTNASTWPTGCTSAKPADMVCPPTTPYVYQLSGNSCVKVKGKVMGAGTPNQYCANLTMPDFKCCNDATTAGCQ